MPGVAETDPHTRGGGKELVVPDGLQQPRSLGRVFRSEQGLDNAAAAPGSFTVGPLRFHFLNMRAVEEHDVQQIHCRLSAVHGAGEAVPNHARQQAAVVDMGMGEQDEVQFCGPIRFGIKVTFFNQGIALMHAAVNGKAYSRRLNDLAGTRDGMGRAQKLNFHRHP
jgi:hypothetical protein